MTFLGIYVLVCMGMSLGSELETCKQDKMAFDSWHALASMLLSPITVPIAIIQYLAEKYNYLD